MENEEPFELSRPSTAFGNNSRLTARPLNFTRQNRDATPSTGADMVSHAQLKVMTGLMSNCDIIGFLKGVSFCPTMSHAPLRPSSPRPRSTGRGDKRVSRWECLAVSRLGRFAYLDYACRNDGTGPPASGYGA